MDKQLFQDYSDQERLDMLNDNADAIEEMDYTEVLSKEEIAERKDDLAIVSIKESRILDEKKKVNDEFKKELKPLTNLKNELLTEIKHSSVAKYGPCYKFIEGTDVGYYNNKGQLIQQRPARQDEAQGTIMQIQRNNEAV